MDGAARDVSGSGDSVDGLTYGSFAVQVAAASPEPLHWLAEFLGPAFQRGARATYAATVKLRENAAAYEDTLAGRPLRGSVDLDCFVNDTHIIRLPSWTAGATTTAFDERGNTLYRVERGTRSVTITTPARSPSARGALMRTVRELAMNRSLRGGGMFLHAAAMAIDGRGLLMVGEKGAGKTTLLLYLLRATGADYISNDRVLLASPPSPTARAMPTIVSLRANTVSAFADLAKEAAARRYHHRYAMAEAPVHRPPVGAITDGVLSLSPAQLCAVLGVGLQAQCAPQALLFPSITSATTAWRLRELSAAEAAARLRRGWLSVGLPKQTSDLFTFPDDPPPPGDAGFEAASRALAARLPALECQLGPRAYDDGTLAAACRRLLGS